MSARARVHAMLPPLDNPVEAEARAAELDARLDAVRVEDLNEAITALGRWLADPNPQREPGLTFAVGVLCSVRDQPNPAEVREKSSPAGADATPDFYQPGYVYSYPRYADGYDWRFRCDALTTHPENGERIALGWRYWQGQWGEYAYGEDSWDIHNCDPAGDLIATPVEEVAS